MPAVADVPPVRMCTPSDELKGFARAWGYKQNPGDRWMGLLFVGAACLVGAGVGYAYEKQTQKAGKR